MPRPKTISLGAAPDKATPAGLMWRQARINYLVCRISLLRIVISRNSSNAQLSPCLKLTKESITQGYRVNAPHIYVSRKFRVDIEEDRHVDRLAGIKPLLLEAEALDLAEIRRDLTRRDAVRSDPNDVVRLRIVRCGVEGKRGFTGQDTHFALLRGEFPR